MAIDKPADKPAAKAAKDRDELTHEARQAELDRQQAIVDAVAALKPEDLAGDGGPILNPGNPGHDPETGKPV